MYPCDGVHLSCIVTSRDMQSNSVVYELAKLWQNELAKLWQNELAKLWQNHRKSTGKITEKWLDTLQIKG